MIEYTIALREVSIVSLTDGSVDTTKCIYIESKVGADEYMDSGDSDGPMSHGGSSSYSCGHTGRLTGPDFGPCDPTRCNRSRSCFRSHD